MYAWEGADYWNDVGNPESFLRSSLDALDGRLRLEAPPSRTAQTASWVSPPLTAVRVPSSRSSMVMAMPRSAGSMTVLPILGLIVAVLWFRRRYKLNEARLAEIDAQLRAGKGEGA